MLSLLKSILRSEEGSGSVLYPIVMCLVSIVLMFLCECGILSKTAFVIILTISLLTVTILDYRFLE